MNHSLSSALAAAALLASTGLAQQDETLTDEPLVPASRPISPMTGPLPLHLDETWSPRTADAPMSQVPGGGSRVFSECDVFVGPNGPMVGPWTQELGAQEILNNQGVGVDGQGNAWMSHDTAIAEYDSTSIRFDLFASPTTGLNYVAMVTGSGTDQLWTKIQAQGGTQFSHIGFYVGVNGGPSGGYGGFFSITPFDQARVYMYVTDGGDTMNVDLDTDFDGNIDDHYESSGILGAGLSLGTGLGIGTYDDGHYDTWSLNGGCISQMCDDFNRADGPMTGFWNPQAGQIDILNQQAVGAAGSTTSWMTRLFFNATEYQDSFIEFDLPPADGSLRYVAAVTGYDFGSGDMLWTKIQAQGGALYNYIGFYQGVNAGAAGGYGSFDSITPFEQGHVYMYVTDGGDTMNVDIDEDYDSIIDYHYESSGILGAGLVLGDGHGFGTFGEGTFDNWSLGGGCPSGPSPVLTVQNLDVGETATVFTRDATPGGVVGFAWSITGGGPTLLVDANCGFLTVDLSPPINTLPAVVADAQGQALFTTTVGGFPGLSLWVQSLDVATCRLSNGFAGTIQ